VNLSAVVLAGFRQSDKRLHFWKWQGMLAQPSSASPDFQGDHK
jgi:hypothetical protein